jgi:integrase
MTMTTENTIPTRQRAPWNSGRLIGQKRPLKPKDVWTIRVRLQLEGRRRDLAMFNLAIDSKLRGCDLVRLKIDDASAGGRIRDRATVIQKKTGRPVQFEITEQTRVAVAEWLAAIDAREGRYLCASRFRGKPHLSTRNTPESSIDGWNAPSSIARHMVRTLCAERNRHRFTRRPAICEQCSCCLATRSWSTVRYLGIEVDDALSISEQVQL